MPAFYAVSARRSLYPVPCLRFHRVRDFEYAGCQLFVFFDAGDAARGGCDERGAVFAVGGFVRELTFVGGGVDKEVFCAVHAVYHLIVGFFVIGEGAHSVSRHKVVFDGEPKGISVSVDAYNSDKGVLIRAHHELNGVAGVERIGNAVFTVEHGGDNLHGAVCRFR